MVIDGQFPIPGRPLSLHTDLADAAALCEILHGVAQVWPTNPPAMKVAREAIWFMWELPRLPRPLVENKYPRSYPWSPQARERVTLSPNRPAGGWSLTYEHLRPQRSLLRELLITKERIDPAVLLAKLRVDRVAAIITKAEDSILTRAGLGAKMPPSDDGTNPWARYVSAGLDVADFRPLDAA